jgi:hypothetical protein
MIRDLMLHTSSLIYGGRGESDIHRRYPAGSSSTAGEMDGARFIEVLGGMPLLHQWRAASRNR